VNGRSSLRLEAGQETRSVALPAVGTSATPDAVRAGDTVHVDVDGRSVPIRLAPPPDVDRAARAAAAAHHGGPVELVAPMPGQVRAIEATVGAAVEAGDTVLVLEAMKMEHSVATTISGRLAELRVVAGDQVARGQVLAVVEP
jgi:acetyl-CoA/propionyl-CoA carboxylase biotin carboxyl carrier protein